MIARDRTSKVFQFYIRNQYFPNHSRCRCSARSSQRRRLEARFPPRWSKTSSPTFPPSTSSTASSCCRIWRSASATGGWSSRAQRGKLRKRDRVRLKSWPDQTRDTFLFFAKSRSERPGLGNVLLQHAPFLRMYADYVRNFDQAMELVRTWTVRSATFRSIIQDIQV